MISQLLRRRSTQRSARERLVDNDAAAAQTPDILAFTKLNRFERQCRVLRNTWRRERISLRDHDGQVGIAISVAIQLSSHRRCWLIGDSSALGIRFHRTTGEEKAGSAGQ